MKQPLTLEYQLQQAILKKDQDSIARLVDDKKLDITARFGMNTFADIAVKNGQRDAFYLIVKRFSNEMQEKRPDFSKEYYLQGILKNIFLLSLKLQEFDLSSYILTIHPFDLNEILHGITNTSLKYEITTDLQTDLEIIKFCVKNGGDVNNPISSAGGKGGSKDYKLYTPIIWEICGQCRKEVIEFIIILRSRHKLRKSKMLNDNKNPDRVSNRKAWRRSRNSRHA